MFRKVWEEAEWEDGHGRCAEEVRQEEARMAVAQNLKATHTVDERVMRVANTVNNQSCWGRVARAAHIISSDSYVMV